MVFNAIENNLNLSVCYFNCSDLVCVTQLVNISRIPYILIYMVDRVIEKGVDEHIINNAT